MAPGVDDHDEVIVLWQSAILEYEKETERKLPPEKLNDLRDVHSPDGLLQKITASGQSFQDFRNKRAHLWSRLKTFASPLQSILALASSSSSVADSFGIPAGTIIDACVYLIQSCENVSNAYDWIEQLFTELQEFSERLNFYVLGGIDPVLKRKIVAILAFVLRVIGRSEYLIRQQRFREYLRVTFLGKDEKTKQLLDDLNKLFGSEQRFVLAVTYATTQEIKAKIVGNDEKLASISEGVKEVQSKLAQAENKEIAVEVEKEIRRILCNTSAADDVEETFVRNKRNLLKGTGAWLVHENFFNTWINHRASILWIFGGPGVGKSYLSTWIIQGLPSRKPGGASFAYFFVKENSQVLRDANVILKTLAWQLVGQDPGFKRHVAEICQQRALTITAEDTWENVFLAYYGNKERGDSFATIVIDGLDEAERTTQRIFLGFMKDLTLSSQSSNRPAIQFAIVGRMSLREGMNFKRQQKGYIIEVSKWKNRQDIDSYIMNRLREFDVLHELRKVKPNGLKRANKTGAVIREKLLEGSDGVFLWAKLLIDTILHKDLAQIETILKNPPGDLDDMIRSVFERLAADDEIDHNMLKRMLLFCTHSQRPLKFGELDHFLSLRGQKVNFLLWKHTRGKLSSIFDLKFPRGYNPDQHDEDGDVDTNEENVDPDSGDFDFTGANSDEDDDVFDFLSSNSQQADSSGTEPETTSPSAQNHLSDGQRKTDVTFCHARIRDFILSVGDHMDRSDGAFAVIPLLQNAHVDITISCLDVLRQELSWIGNEDYLTDYPLRYMAVHLERVNKDHISDDEFYCIVEGLYWVFGTERGAKSFILANQDDSHTSFYHSWVGDVHNILLVQKWFHDAKDRNSVWARLDSDAKSWMIDATKGYKILLRPSMMAASRLWLTKLGWDDPGYGQKGEFFVWLLHGWLSLVDTGYVSQDIKEFEFQKSWESFDLLSVERLELLANWAGFEHDSHWHTAIGWHCRSGHFLDQAASHYEQAIAQNPLAWVALEGMGSIYAGRGEYQLAIDFQRKALEALPENIKYLGGSGYASIADYNLTLGNKEAAVEAARLGFEFYPFSPRGQSLYLKALGSVDDSDTIMSTIELLNYNFSDGYTWLALSFMSSNFDAYDEIGRAIRIKGQSEWVFKDMDEALQLLAGENRPWATINLSCQMMRFSLTWYDDRDVETIKLTEAFLERLGKQPAGTQEYLEPSRRAAILSLAQLYFDQAVSLYKAGGEPNVYVEKLKGMAVSVDTSFAEEYDGFDFYRADYASLLWGRWVREYQKAEENVWRKCFKPILLCQMNSLDDDDPANDEVGMRGLVKSLFHTGDRRNAAAILSVIFKPLEDAKATGTNTGTDENEEQATESEGNTLAGNDNEPQANFDAPLEPVHIDGDAAGVAETIEDESTIHSADFNKPAQAERVLSLNVTSAGCDYSCDGCACTSSEVAELYFCEICDDVNWCGDCLPLLRDRSIVPGLKEHVCNPFHTFCRAWPIAEETKGLAAEYLNGEVQLKKEWLNTLRTEWLNVV